MLRLTILPGKDEECGGKAKPLCFVLLCFGGEHSNMHGNAPQLKLYGSEYFFAKH